MTLLLDCYDSFTYMLRDYVAQCGQQAIIVRSDEKSTEEIGLLAFDNILLSPGPKTPKEAGVVMQLIDRYWQHIPILGICLGHQAIGEYFGASLVHAASPRHGKTSSIRHTGHPIFENIPSPTTVMRYHSLILKDLPPKNLSTIATTSDGELMAMTHNTQKIVGIQYHPESILTADGLQLIKNWYHWIAN